MNFDEIVEALETHSKAPDEALRAAVAHASTLAPIVVELIGKMNRGVFLTPRQANLLFYGLHVLSAASETSAFKAFIDLLYRDVDDLESVFGDALTETLSGVLIGLFDGDAEPLYAFLEGDLNDGSIKWGVFQTLAYLAWQGRTSHPRLIDFLKQFPELVAGCDSDDPQIEGWRDAVHLLGLEELRQSVIDSWEGADENDVGGRERKYWCEHFTVGASAEKFYAAHVRPFTDPASALSWIDVGDEPQQSPGGALTLAEKNWLAGFLDSDQVPMTTLSFEELDGYLCALAVSPRLMPPSHWMARIWDSNGMHNLTYDSPQQMAVVVDLLMRHWNAITQALNNEESYLPFVPLRLAFRGHAWASGFMTGMNEQPEAWRRDMGHEEVNQAIQEIISLYRPQLDSADDLLDEEALDDVSLDEEAEDDELLDLDQNDAVSQLPELLAILADHRRQHIPIKRAGEKLKRNDPCPCGSGRKYKACCLDAAAA